jgi:glutaredoxin-like protein
MKRSDWSHRSARNPVEQEDLVEGNGYTGVNSSSSPITVFWRPGCPYCWRLRSKLRRAGVHTDEVNIWEDTAAAAFVRSITGGDETVPIVRIGSQSLVNPSPRWLLEKIREVQSGTSCAP